MRNDAKDKEIKELKLRLEYFYQMSYTAVEALKEIRNYSRDDSPCSGVPKETLEAIDQMMEMEEQRLAAKGGKMRNDAKVDGTSSLELVEQMRKLNRRLKKRLEVTWNGNSQDVMSTATIGAELEKIKRSQMTWWGGDYSKQGTEADELTSATVEVHVIVDGDEVTVDNPALLIGLWKLSQRKKSDNWHKQLLAALAAEIEKEG